MDNRVKKEVVDNLPDNIRYDVARYMRIENLYESAIKEVCTRLEILNNEFEIRFDRNPIHHVEKRVKSPESIFRKLEKYGFSLSLQSAVENINDIAGIRVVCFFISDVYDIQDMLCKQDDIVVKEKRDYIKNPKPTGYRSLHLIIDVPVHTISDKKMVPVEIQIRTVAMDYFASIEHQLKYKNKQKLTSESDKELIDCADIIAETDKIMEDIFQKTYKISDES